MTIEAVGSCGRCHAFGHLVAHGSLCAACLDDLTPTQDVPSGVDRPTARQETHQMAETKKSRSGSRAPKNPKTKAQRLVRAKELTDRIDARLAEVEALGAERNQVVQALRDIDGATYREISEAVGKSEQAIHKALHKTRARAS